MISSVGVTEWQIRARFGESNEASILLRYRRFPTASEYLLAAMKFAYI